MSGNSSISDNVFDSQIIKNDQLKSTQNKVNDIVATFAGLVPATEQLKQIINPEKIYVAQFPKDILEKMKSGEYDLLHTKSGDILSNIIDKTLPKNNIIHNVRLAELNPDMVNKVQNLSNNVMNMAVQQQLTMVLEELSEVKKLSASIKRGQELDRIGLVYSGKRQLENALEASRESRTILIQNAIQSLENGRTQIEYNLKESLNQIQDIPTSKFKILFKNLFNNAFYGECENTYNDFQESFRAYLDASIYLAIAYSQINSEKAMLKVFEPTKSLILESSPKMKLLSSIAVSGKIADDLMWYGNTEKIIKFIDNYSQNSLLNSSDFITMEIEGRKLIS
ncbi:hypothetical protein M4D71_20675 [Niallia taxi]|uniref:hypothetical protein n=1 Tax=Niallia taxi TaxID=2499688 RepID=UPI0021A74803|nr:hypothetical protein [Niallia taxi]MCT2346571.1 hypothetical protein [Niallia taxi]